MKKLKKQNVPSCVVAKSYYLSKIVYQYINNNLSRVFIIYIMQNNHKGNRPWMNIGIFILYDHRNG